MSLLAQIKSLSAYNDWANGHVIDAASALNDEDYARELGASFGSVRGNLAHIVGAQTLWLAASTPLAVASCRRWTEAWTRCAASTPHSTLTCAISWRPWARAT